MMPFSSVLPTNQPTHRLYCTVCTCPSPKPARSYVSEIPRALICFDSPVPPTSPEASKAAIAVAPACVVGVILLKLVCPFLWEKTVKKEIGHNGLSTGTVF